MSFPFWSRRPTAVWWLALLWLAWLVRLPRLTWQPLWWDEGYSVYFATEPWSRMLALTAADIHPPLYYTLLQLWLGLNGSVLPATLRLGSAWVGVVSIALLVALARRLYPQQPWVAWLAGLLLAVNPMHLFYSQEVRMYGLALAAGLASTLALWRWRECIEQQKPTVRAALVYGLWAAVALYTLYYLALLLLAHVVWIGWRDGRRLTIWRSLLVAYALALALYLPWLVYSLPQLTAYVADKIPADADLPLGLIDYLSRHLLAFTAGHLRPPNPGVQAIRWVVLAAPLLLLVSLVLTTRNHTPLSTSWQARAATPEALLAVCCLAPLAAAFALNLRLPFFPDGGERLLLFILPFGLLLSAALIGRAWRNLWLGPLALGLLLLGAVTGGWTFYTLPRYPDQDYRPLIRQIVQESGSDDHVLAIFPWLVGFWRTYSADVACQTERTACTVRRGIGDLSGPHLLLLSDRTAAWGGEVQATVDRLLSGSALWFPAPLSFGSTLPAEIETHLARQAVNLENRWFTPAIRLSVWSKLASPTEQPLGIDFGSIQLAAGGIAPAQIASANQPLAVKLVWAGAPTPDLGVTVRLLDAAGRPWASRTYAPLGGLTMHPTTEDPSDLLGLLVPTGLAPATYTVAVGVVLSSTGELVSPIGSADAQTQLAPIGVVTVTLPDTAQPGYRLPIQQAITPPVVEDGVALLGATASLDNEADILAGEAIEVMLFLQARQPTPPDRHWFVALQAADGATVAEGVGQSPAGWPVRNWPNGALAQAPVRLTTPATLAAGDYRLVAGMGGPAGNARSPAVVLGALPIQRRSASFIAPTPPQPLTDAIQFGAHARLYGYDQVQEGATLTLHLYWEVLQTLLPPHAIFVHLDDASGTTLTQADGPPHTANERAPTGTWLPGEFLVTVHQVPLPPDMPAATLQIGLYQPETGQRLPASSAGQPTGDAAEIPLLR